MTTATYDFSGRTVLVTGSGQNLGRTIAREFARSGADVILHDRELVDGSRSIAFDLGRPEEIERAFERMEEEKILPDILINNAAHLGLGNSGFLEQDAGFFREVLEVNLIGLFRCSQLAARAMAKRGRGAIVHISSLAGERSVWGRSAYNASKGAVDALTRSMAIELAPLGIRVNAIAPGYVWTPRWNDLEPGVEERRRENIPCQAPTQQEEIARLALFAASDEAPSLIGSRLIIDGGLGSQQVPRDAAL